MSELINMFSYHFMQRALVVGILVSLCAALLGVSLVLKRYSMIGDGLSHVGFGALAIASAFNLAPLAVAVPVVVAAAVLLLRLRHNAAIKGDAAIAMISSSSLAIGVICVSLTTGMNTDVSSYMFGSVLAMTWGDVALSAALSIAVLVLFYAVGHWNNYFNALIYLSKAEHYPLQLYLRNVLILEDVSALMGDTEAVQEWLERLERKEAMKFGVVVVSSVPVLVLYPFLQKYFVKGMTIGAIKG